MTIIAHASIPADNPDEVAKVLAEMLQGEAMPFPPAGPSSCMAWSGDGAVEIEVATRGHVLSYGETQGHWGLAGPVNRHSEAHLAICVERPAEEIMAIATRAGWPVRHCDRGGGLFQLSEVWVEGAFMIEFLDPAQTARYREVVTPENWKRYLQMMQGKERAPA
jgi:hypothetical protein